MLKYKFYIRKNQQTATATEIHPVWKDDLSMDYAMESQQWFHRKQLSGSIDLLGSDYDLIMAENFGTQFFLEIRTSADGTNWNSYWMGRFTLTDCVVNVDDKILTVKANVVDRYSAILDGMEKEFDLIKLKPAIERLVIRKRPCLQVYYEGDSVVSCVYGNLSFEQDASMNSTGDAGEFLRDRCHFDKISSYCEINFTQVASGQEAYFSTPFTGSITASGSRLTNSSNMYYLEYFKQIVVEPVVGGNDVYHYQNGFIIKKTSDDTSMWKFEQEYSTLTPGDWNYLELPVEMTFEAMSGNSLGNMQAVRTSPTVWARLVCNVENLGGTETYPLYNDDLVGFNRNYTRAKGIVVGTQQSTRTSQTPTEWGRADNGEYFLPPDDNSHWFPIGRSRWVNSSIWFSPSADFEKFELMGTYQYLLNDVYPLHACINALLGEVAPDITFGNSTTYSAFLYSGSDAIAHRDNRLFLTPKSNITAGEYQTPAQKGMITLKQVLEMLRDTYKCYWFIDDSNRLRIEHVQWFINGGTYTPTTPQIGVDLTALINKRNGKSWAYGTNRYDFEKMNMPERYEFEWMDEVTDIFKGNPIDIVSPYVERGKVETIGLSAFDSDVDFMLLNPSAISKEGFALMTSEPAIAISQGTFQVQSGSDYPILPIAAYTQGKTCTLQLSCMGVGTMKLMWWYGNRKEDANVSISVDSSFISWNYTIVPPEGVTAISFESSAAATVIVSSLTVNNGNPRQVPMVSAVMDGVTYTMQNGMLSFFMLQNPYWLYDMPAKRVKLNGSVALAVSVQRNKKQTVNIPLGDTEPNITELVKTGLGNGQVQSMSIKMTSRMAKTQLRYDTEQ